ncbi:MAG: hypothetical protein HC845_12100 [Akkermansiaceae bacterium]|nr:hypothetical protein [Akkermansiaceae bacterium]
MIGNASSEILRIDISVGSPLSEAIFTIMKKNYPLIASRLSSSEKLTRIDTFLLKDKKVLYVESKASCFGDTFEVAKISLFDVSKVESVKKEELKFSTCFDLEKLILHDNKAK